MPARARGAFWIDSDGYHREIQPYWCIWGLRPGDVLLVTSKSILADIIDNWTVKDTPAGKSAPRLTHAEMVKMIAPGGPVVVSAELNGLVNKQAERHFEGGRSGQVWRHPAFTDKDVCQALRDIMDADQGRTISYSVEQAIFASDMAEKLLGWIPAVKSAKIYQARAKFCSRAVADWLKTLEDALRLTGIYPLIPGDGPREKLSPRELWYAFERSQRESAGWRKVAEWNL